MANWATPVHCGQGSRRTPPAQTGRELPKNRGSSNYGDRLAHEPKETAETALLEALRSGEYGKIQPTAAVRRAQSRIAVRRALATGACNAMLLLVVPLLTLEVDARGGGGGGHGGGGHGGGGHHGGGHGAAFGGHGGHHGGHGGGGVRSFRAAHSGGAHIAARSTKASRSAGHSARTGGSHLRGATLQRIHPEVAVRSVPRSAHAVRLTGYLGIARSPMRLCDRNSHRRVSTAHSLVRPGLGGVAASSSAGSGHPTPIAYDDVYYGIYGPYAYNAPYRQYVEANGRYAGRSPRRGVSSGRYAAPANPTERRPAEVCSDDAAQLTDWPIEHISEVVQPTDAQRPALNELRASNAKAVDMLKSGCPKDLPSTPPGRLAAMESRLQVMLAAVQTVRPALERFYHSLSDEQKARFNALAAADNPDAAAKDRRELTTFCDEKTPGLADLPIDRIAQAVQPTPAQRASLDELQEASVEAAERLKANCPGYQTLTPTGRVEAMEKRLDTTLGAVKTLQPAMVKFYNSLSDLFSSTGARVRVTMVRPPGQAHSATERPHVFLGGREGAREGRFG
jgi:LTXXQ motif family protein